MKSAPPWKNIRGFLPLPENFKGGHAPPVASPWRNLPLLRPPRSAIDYNFHTSVTIVETQKNKADNQAIGAEQRMMDVFSILDY